MFANDAFEQSWCQQIKRTVARYSHKILKTNRVASVSRNLHIERIFTHILSKDTQLSTQYWDSLSTKFEKNIYIICRTCQITYIPKLGARSNYWKDLRRKYVFSAFSSICFQNCIKIPDFLKMTWGEGLVWKFLVGKPTLTFSGYFTLATLREQNVVFFSLVLQKFRHIPCRNLPSILIYKFWDMWRYFYANWLATTDCKRTIFYFCH